MRRKGIPRNSHRISTVTKAPQSTFPGPSIYLNIRTSSRCVKLSIFYFILLLLKNAGRLSTNDLEAEPNRVGVVIGSIDQCDGHGVWPSLARGKFDFFPRRRIQRSPG